MKPPSSAAMDLPAVDGTLLHLTLHRDETSSGRGFQYGSLLEVQEHTPSGLRPLVGYRVDCLLAVEGDLTLHDGVPGLTITRNWLTILTDWIVSMIDENPGRTES